MSSARRLVSVSLAAVLLVAAVVPVAAGRQWCRKDPVVLVGGVPVTVDIAVWEAHLPHVTGPIAVTLRVPADVEATLVMTDDGFNGFGETVAIAPAKTLKRTARGIQARIEVSVPANRIDMPVDVFVSQPTGRTATVNGKSNNVVVVAFVVLPAP